MLRGERSVLSWLQPEKRNDTLHTSPPKPPHGSCGRSSHLLSHKADAKLIRRTVPNAVHVRNIRPFTFAAAWQF